jgi:hypothetical protein
MGYLDDAFFIQLPPRGNSEEAIKEIINTHTGGGGEPLTYSELRTLKDFMDLNRDKLHIDGFLWEA